MLDAPHCDTVPTIPMSTPEDLRKCSESVVELYGDANLHAFLLGRFGGKSMKWVALLLLNEYSEYWTRKGICTWRCIDETTLPFMEGIDDPVSWQSVRCVFR